MPRLGSGRQDDLGARSEARSIWVMGEPPEPPWLLDSL